jgi:hypothetical protein
MKGVELAGVMDPNFGQGTAAAWNREVDPGWLDVHEPPGPRRGRVAEGCGRPGIEECGMNSSLQWEGAMPNRINMAMNAIKPSGVQPSGDHRVGEAVAT